MNPRALSLSLVGAALALRFVAGCAGTDASGDLDGMSGGSGGASPSGGAAPGASGSTSGGSASGGASGGAVAAGSPGMSGAAGSALAGSSGMTTGGKAGMATGGAPDGNGGAPASGGAGGANGGAGGLPSGTGGSGVAGGFVAAGAGGGPMVEPLDCGPKATALESHGPPSNRVNYVIAGDGYSEEELQPGGALDQHMEAMLEERFLETGQPYLRYRNFVNICVLRVPSSPICGSSVFGCCGSDSSRLASCDNSSINQAIMENTPDSMEVDWRAAVLNGDSWWNSGGQLMMFSGGNDEAGGAALHEGGHGFHALSDEYDACEVGRVSNEASYGVNVSLDGSDSGGKFDGWIGYNQNPGTGEQGFFACSGGQTWRPSSNSMMNQLFGDDPDTSYNPVSREKIVMDIWRIVESPYDSVTPAEGPVSNPTVLTVNVIDPEVISVDWTLDGNVVATDGGPSYDIGAAGLAPGMHIVTARAYDNAGTDLVRQVPGTTFNRQYWGSGAMGHSDKTVTWTVTIP